MDKAKGGFLYLTKTFNIRLNRGIIIYVTLLNVVYSDTNRPLSLSLC